MKAMKFQPFEGDQSASKDTKAINVFRAHHSLCLGLPVPFPELLPLPPPPLPLPPLPPPRSDRPLDQPPCERMLFPPRESFPPQRSPPPLPRRSARL
mmetsp:Transcript_11016/g.22966  ORF Transcript_11016/g.22966 Transcript_11016/m.22966 type:complete len:97 (+) Transcript_11016:26-316(+)